MITCKNKEVKFKVVHTLLNTNCIYIYIFIYSVYGVYINRIKHLVSVDTTVINTFHTYN